MAFSIFLGFGVSSFIIYFIIFKRFWEKTENPSFPDKFLLEKVIGEKYYNIITIVIGFILCVLTWLVAKEVTRLFIPLVIPTGLYFLRKLFYGYKKIYEIYEKDFSPLSEEYRNQVIKLSTFHYNHVMTYIFVIWFFVIPATYFEYFSRGIFFTLLIAIEYFFIGFATWVCAFGSYFIIYTLGRYFSPKEHIIYKDEFSGYKSLADLVKLTVLTIAIVPGIGLPSVLNLNLIFTSPPVQVALFWYTFANISIFLIGIYGIHKGMSQVKKGRMSMLSGKIKMLKDEIEQNYKTINLDVISYILLLDVVQDEYKIVSDMREWPLNFSIVSGGLGSSFLPPVFTIVVRLLLWALGITSW